MVGPLPVETRPALIKSMATKKKPAVVTVEQVKAAIENRRIIVVPVDKGVGHFYQAFFRWSKEMIGEFRSVTGINDIIGGGKTRALMGWAKKICIAALLEDLAKMERETGKMLHEFTPEMARLIEKNEPTGIPWLDVAVKIAKGKTENILKDAADIGHRTHEAIDAYINGKPMEAIDVKVQTAYNNFIKWAFENDVKWCCGDLPVVSAKHAFGGRLDALGIMNGELVLFDWKTANDIRDDVALQMGGYNIALFESCGIKATRGITVRFGKDNPTEFEWAECELKHSEKTFLYARGLDEGFRKKLLWKKVVV